MSCSPFDLRDYFLNELAENAAVEMRAHLKTCRGCSAELQRLRTMEAALLSVRDQELPRRIAFVAEPPASRVRGWLARFWGSAARLAFGAAAMLSVAMVISALVQRPSPVYPVAAPPSVDLAKVEADLAGRVDQAVRQAVAESEARQARKTAALLAASERKAELERKQLLLAFEDNMVYLQKRLNVALHARNDYGASE